MAIYYLFFVSFGFPIAFLLNPEYTELRLFNHRYFFGIYYDQYIAISILALSSIILGVSIKISKIKNISSNPNQKVENTKNYYFAIGIALISIYAIYLTANWLTGSIPTEYLEFKKWSGNQANNYLQMLFWYGVIFCISVANKKQLIVTLLASLIPALILTLTGNRNDVIYPLLIGLGLFVNREGKIPKKMLFVISIFVFFLSPIIASTRSAGITLEVDKTLNELIVQSILEMGGQLGSVSHMFSWINSGELHAFGGTYMYATIALFLGFINPQVRMNYFASRFSIETRLPALAFTMPGELFYNFSSLGVIIGYFIIGRYIRKKDMATMNEDDLVIYGFWSLMILHWVRNQFYFSAAYIFIFYILYITEKFIIRAILPRRRVNNDNKIIKESH